jgi:tRNA(Phe) wybutosine-synthesizing methylase Tyw3
MWIPNATTTGAPAAEADIAAPVAAAAHSTTVTSTSTEATPCSGCDAPAPLATTLTDDVKGDATASVLLDAGAIYNKESAPAHGGGTKRGSWGASGWLVNSHFPIADPAVAVLSALREFCTERSIAAPHLFDAASTASSSPTPATAAASSEQQQGNDQVTLLMEPFVMHVQCRTMRAAHTLFAAAVQAGFRNSGIATGGAIPERAGPNALPPKLTVAIRHTAGVQVPLVTHGRCYATADYVRAMAEHCNELLTANNTERIDRLTNEVRRRLTGGVAVAPAAAAAAL